MFRTVRWDDVALPRWPTVLGEARRTLAPALGFRPRYVYRAAASETNASLPNSPVTSAPGPDLR